MDLVHISWWEFPSFGFWLIGILIGIVIIVYVIIHSEKSEKVEVLSDPHKILNKHYTKSEIIRKEYIQAKDILTKFKVD